MILGNLTPMGINNFKKILIDEQPDIIHFHELIAGRGPGIYHVEAAYSLNLKIVLTAHLSYYSCQTGTLMQNAKTLCSGKIDISVCSNCVYQTKGIKGFKLWTLKSASSFFHSIKINPLKWNSTFGTAMGVPFLIKKKYNNLIRLSHFCDKIVSLTDFYTKILLLNKVPANKIATVKQGVPGANLYIKENRVKEKRKFLKLIFIGRISAFKGLHILIEALKNIPNDLFKLDIFGELGDDSYTKNCIDSSALITSIRWKGTIRDEEKYRLLPTYDLLLLPSTFSEMSPLVIQEAYAAGIPVLASDVYGNAEQITDGENGWLFKFNDAADLTIKIQTLLDNTHLIEEARKQLLTVKSFKEVAMEYLTIYKKVLEKNSETNKESSRV